MMLTVLFSKHFPVGQRVAWRVWREAVVLAERHGGQSKMNQALQCMRDQMTQLRSVRWRQPRTLRRALPYLTCLWILILLLRSPPTGVTRARRRRGWRYESWEDTEADTTSATQDTSPDTFQDGDEGREEGRAIKDKGGLFLQGHKWCYNKADFLGSSMNRTAKQSLQSSGECMCETGWSGLDCKVPVCSGCKHGHCMRPETCRCNPGWEGKKCDSPVCRKGMCGQHGECAAPNRCRCNPGYSGSGCGFRCEHGVYHAAQAPDFNSAATLQVNQRCVCHEGWGGPACLRPKCEKYGCGNGVCTRPDNCMCDLGFDGRDCRGDALAEKVNALMPPSGGGGGGSRPLGGRDKARFASLTLHKGSPGEAWSHLASWTDSLFSEADAVSRDKMLEYLPENDTLILPPSVRGSNSRQQSKGKQARETGTQRYNRCAVVGDSGGLLSTELGEFIDGHDAVLRFNFAPTVHLDRHVGRRTTIRLLNYRATSSMLHRNFNQRWVEQRGGGEHVRYLLWRPEVYPLYPMLARKLPQGDHLELLRSDFVQYVADMYSMTYSRMRREAMMPPDLLDNPPDAVKSGGGAAGAAVRKTSSPVPANAADAASRVPSSVVGVLVMLHLCKGPVHLFGFDPPSVQDQVKELGFTTATYYDTPALISMASEHAPLGTNLTEMTTRVWNGIRGEHFPGSGGSLGKGGYDHALLRMLELLGFVRICTTTGPEKCLESGK